MRITIVAFARLRELLGETRALDCADGTTAADLWNILAASEPRLIPFAESTRFARNGRVLADTRERLQDGDEFAVLPPVGGG